MQNSGITELLRKGRNTEDTEDAEEYKGNSPRTLQELLKSTLARFGDCSIVHLSQVREADGPAYPSGAEAPGYLAIKVSECRRHGATGWAYKDWEGIVYPADLKKKKQHPLEFLAQYFDLVEINTSFYGHIKPEIGRQWTKMATDVNSNFIFTAKLNRAFTHSPVAVVEAASAMTIKPGDDDEKLAKEGLDAIANEGRLGVLLIQFPISFKNTDENRRYLEQLISRFRQYPLVVEVRHATWNNDQVLAQFAAEGVAFCNIDQPLLGKAIRPSTHVTATIGYVRLHGRRYDQWFTNESSHERYNYLYKLDELERWKAASSRLQKKRKRPSSSPTIISKAKPPPTRWS